MKKLTLIAILLCSLFAVQAQSYQNALKRTETFVTDDNRLNTTDMDLNNGLAQIGYLRPGLTTIVNTPSNSVTATRIHFTHLDAFNPGTVINKLIMPLTENPFFLDDNKKYYPKEIRKINQGYIVCGYTEEDPNCNPCAKKNAFLMKLNNSGMPLMYKQYAITDSTKDYIILNSVAPVNDGAQVHGFVTCGYRWENSKGRKKAYVMVVDENLDVLGDKEVNESAVLVSQLNANRYPDSWYSKIDRYTDNELFMVGAVGVVGVAEPSLATGTAYYRGDVIFARCSTNVTIRPSTPLIVTSVNLFSNFNDVVELGVGLVQGTNYSNGADYILMIDHIDDQFTSSTFTSRNSTIAIAAIGSVHNVNYSTWVNGGVQGRIDYQNTNVEQGVDILLDANNKLFILSSYNGIKKPIESELFLFGGNVSAAQGDDYIGALGGDLIPRDLEDDGTGRKILTHYEGLPHVEKIYPQGYVSTLTMPQCQGNYHQVANFSYSHNKGTSKTYLTPSISVCTIPMKDYEIPIQTQDPCTQNRMEQNKNDDKTDKNKFGAIDGLKVYPNPAGSVATLEFTDKIATASKLEIISISGQIIIAVDNVDAKANGSLLDVDVSGLADGVYFCRVSDGNGGQLQTRFHKVSGK